MTLHIDTNVVFAAAHIEIFIKINRSVIAMSIFHIHKKSFNRYKCVLSLMSLYTAHRWSTFSLDQSEYLAAITYINSSGCGSFSSKAFPRMSVHNMPSIWKKTSHLLVPSDIFCISMDELFVAYVDKACVRLGKQSEGSKKTKLPLKISFLSYMHLLHI